MTVVGYWLYLRVEEWYRHRVQRYVANVETQTARLIAESKFSECIKVLTRGRAFLDAQGVASDSADASALRHLLAKVLIFNSQYKEAEVLLTALVEQYEGAGAEDSIFAEALEDLGRALGAQPGRESEARAIWQRCIDVHTACAAVADEADISAVIDSLTLQSPSSAPAGDFRPLEYDFSSLASPTKRLFVTHSAVASPVPATLDHPANPKRINPPRSKCLHIERLAGLLADLDGNSGARESPTSITAIE